MTDSSDLFRYFDPARGPFEPRNLEPIVNRETNPRGSRHILKTMQDRMPRDQRSRVREANRQLELRRQGK